MNNDYTTWLQKRKNTTLSPEFAEKILTGINQREDQPFEILSGWKLSLCLEWISQRPIIQEALVIVGFIGGIARLAAIFQVILLPFGAK